MMADPLDARLDLNLRVTHLEVSIAWYSRVFGTEAIYRGTDRSKAGSSVALACFRLGGIKLWLLPASDPEQGRQRVGMALMTRQPLAPLRAQLALRGATFDDGEMVGFPVESDGVRRGRDSEFFYLLDPDGHRIEYCRTYPAEG